MSERVSLDNLIDSRITRLLHWPEGHIEVVAERVEELKELGVSALILTGRHRLADMRVLGKGHTGIVVAAETLSGLLALKAMRSDSDRASMEEEARLLSAANLVGVGPKLIAWSSNFLLMELVEGGYLSDWIRGITPNKGDDLRRVLRSVVDQARRLDEAGIDHGELVRLHRHVILRCEVPIIIDFESASTKRRPANVTTVIQSFFLNTKVSDVIGGLIGLPGREALLESLRVYRRKPSKESYDALLTVAGLC